MIKTIWSKSLYLFQFILKSISWFVDSFFRVLILNYLTGMYRDSFCNIYNWSRHRWHCHHTFQFTLRKLSTLLWRWCTLEAHLKQRGVNYSNETAVIDWHFSGRSLHIQQKISKEIGGISELLKKFLKMCRCDQIEINFSDNSSGVI